MSDLKIVKVSKLAEEQSNFWNCCPLLLEFLPTSACEEGIPEKSKDNRIIKSPHCDWWINSPKHNYCFWRFIQDKSNPDGSMKELVQSDLAKLFGWSSAKTSVMLKEATEELITVFRKHNLMGELEDIAENYEFMDMLASTSDSEFNV